MVGGGVAGGIAGSKHPTDIVKATEAGEKAGVKFAEKHGGKVIGVAFLASGAISVIFSFSGVLPWCRKPA